MTDALQVGDGNVVPRSVKEIHTRNSERAWFLAFGLYLLFVAGSVATLIVVHIGSNGAVGHWVVACIFLPVIPAAGIGVLVYTITHWKYFHYLPPPTD